MANVATVPTQGQILVNVDDITLFEPLRQAISMFKGVVSVKLKRQEKTGMLSEQKQNIREDSG